jgi:hypothetical protein
MSPFPLLQSGESVETPRRRPAQQINVTSFGVTITADEIAKARAIVQEVVGPLGLAANGPGSGPRLLEASSHSQSKCQ